MQVVIHEMSCDERQFCCAACIRRCGDTSGAVFHSLLHHFQLKMLHITVEMEFPFVVYGTHTFLTGTYTFLVRKSIQLHEHT